MISFVQKSSYSDQYAGLLPKVAQVGALFSHRVEVRVIQFRLLLSSTAKCLSNLGSTVISSLGNEISNMLLSNYC